MNDQTVHVFHVPRAHTDGDGVVHFREANVIHTGDIVFWGRYPFIDIDSGGSVDGMIDAEKSLEEIQAAGLSEEFDADWGGGSIPPGRWVELLHRDLVRGVGN